MKTDEEDCRKNEGLDTDRAFDLYQEGLIALEAGRTAAAKELFQESWHRGPHFKTAEVLGRVFFENEELPEAVLFLAAAVGLQPSAGPARVSLARALVECEDPIAAWIHVEAALTHRPGYRKAVAIKEQLATDPRVVAMLARED